MARVYWLAFFPLILFSCKTPGNSLFTKRSPHEQYGKKLTDAGLEATALGRAWFSSASRALAQPLAVTLPYTQVGYFAQEKPDALGLRFSVKRGQQLNFEIEKNPANGFTIYADLWQQEASGGTPDHVLSADTTEVKFSLDADEDATYILRLQPELLKSGSYTLKISIGPSLGFPVAGKSARIGSVWGDSREAGARRHEGIDIFAPRGTAAIAATDGLVGRVNENNLGGKVVWFRPSGKNMTLYYAHLDEQLVSAGQRVKKGDTLGLVGNTGNARTTPPHLHFGIYAMGGAIDPLPFVNPVRKEAPRFSYEQDRLNRAYRLKKEIRYSEASIERNSLLFVQAASPGHLVGQLPDGSKILVERDNIQAIESQLFDKRVADSAVLLDAPAPNAPVKALLPPRQEVSVHAFYKGFVLVRTGGQEGWLPAERIR